MKKKFIAAGLGIAAFAGAAQLIDTPTKNDTLASTQVMTFCHDFGAKPDPTCYAGVANADITQANIKQNICNKSWSTKSIRPPVSYTNGLKVKEIQAEGLLDADPAHYELDHLISLELGGNPTDPHNLWPEKYCVSGGGCSANDPRASKDSDGAKSKDQVENKCHKAVCSGKLSLLEAQKEIVSDWKTACQ